MFFLNFWNFSALTWKKTAVVDGFVPYLAQMITSVRGCVAYNDLWPWPISSWSFGLGLENRIRSVASTVPDGFFPYLAQMITSMRRCVACDDLWFGTQHDSVVWVIMRRRGVSSERRRSSLYMSVHLSFFYIWATLSSRNFFFFLVVVVMVLVIQYLSFCIYELPCPPEIFFSFW